MNRLYKYVGFLSVLALVCVAAPLQSLAATLPAGFTIETLATGLDKPTALSFTPDGRAFIAEKDGKVRVFKNGVLLATPLITLTDINYQSDHGILGIAVDPNFAQNGYVYLAYTYESNPADIWGLKTGRIVRITVQGDTSSEATKVVIVGKISGTPAAPSCDNLAVTVDCIPSSSPSHSMGGLRFGPDGKLYATLGDGAGFENADPRALKSQNIDALAGKMLRINTDGTGLADNPFYDGNVNSNRSKVWAYGFRNAYRFNFQPTTGTLFAGDVGWKFWEEIDVVKKGGNYGWPCREGFVKDPEYNCTVTGYTDPIYSYDHSTPSASITGGSFPTQNVYPAQYMKSYFFGDVTGSVLKRMELDANNTVVSVTDFLDNAMGPVEIMTGPDGRIYYLAIYNGEFRRINYSAGNHAPVAAVGATPLTGASPLTVNFSSAGSTDSDGDTLSYVWNFGDGQTSTQANPAHIYTTENNFTASLTVNDGKGGTDTKTIVIRVGASNANNIIPTHVKTVAAPIPAYIGRDIILTSTVKNVGAANPFIVDMEIYNKAGTKVAQKIFENTVIPTNTTKDFEFSWFPTDVGDYRMIVGLFQTNWTGLYQWTNEASNFTVLNRAPTTTPPTPVEDFKLQLNSIVLNNTTKNLTTTEGADVTIDTQVVNNGAAGKGIVDVEIYKDGQKVFQKYFDPQYAQKEIQDFLFTWKAGTQGTYKVSVGLFKQDWNGAFSWNADVATITVNAPTVPVPPTTPTPGTAADVYKDNLATGWANWSWDTDAAMGADLKATFKSPWAGLFLHTNGFNTLGKTALKFDISGQPNPRQAVQVLIYGENGNVIATKQVGDNGSYSIALSELNAVNKMITGIAFQGQTGQTPAPITLDNIRFE